MNTKEILIFLIIGLGWVAFGQIIFKYIKKFLSRNPEKELSFKGLIFDLIFLCLGFYAFYNKFWHEVISELGGNLPLIILVYFIYFGTLIPFGFPKLFHQFFRYGITILIIYAVIVFGLWTFIFNKPSLSLFLRQSWGIYNWFLLVLFPIEIGNLARRLRLYIKLKNN